MDITLIKKKGSHGGQLCIAVGFSLAPLLGTDMICLRGFDFSEGPAAAFLKTVSFGGDTGLKIAVPSLLKA